MTGRLAYPIRRLVVSGLVVLGAVATPGSGVAQIEGTVHNLSATGPGAVSSSTEQEVCVFCHTPHGALDRTPLWNREARVSGYTPYDSPSLDANPGQPNGYSKLCLSCHDGTIAIGEVRNLRGAPGNIAVANTNGGMMPAGNTHIGTDLMNDHPVSFEFTTTIANNDTELVQPTTDISPLRLFQGGAGTNSTFVQCTTCHDPHTNAQAKFLRKPLTGRTDNLCLTCHDKTGWPGSVHESSSTEWPAGGTQLQVHSCSMCHDPHTETGAQRLLRNGASGGESAIEETCFQCHKSSGAGGVAQNIQGEFAKTGSSHPITTAPGVHAPVFTANPAEPVQPNQKHVECVDCHNPHRATPSNRTEGMPGLDTSGGLVSNVVNDPAPSDGQPSLRQYPVCLRCHGDTYLAAVGATTASGVPTSNKANEFNTANSSFHPVAGPGRNSSGALAQQLSGNGLNTGSVIKCTDCHNSDAYSGDAGRVNETALSASGPHGSSYPSLLRANFWSDLPGPSNWNGSNFELCFLCHTQNRLMARERRDGARTNFYNNERDENLHHTHLNDRSDRTRAICKSCHYNIHSNVDAQNTEYVIDGVLYTTPPVLTGVSTNLINFHPMVAPTGGRTRPRWTLNTGNRQRSCNLQCHGTNGGYGSGDVMAESYSPAAADDYVGN
jgi:predicted CXXCH cytochrome family protein